MRPDTHDPASAGGERRSFGDSHGFAVIGPGELGGKAAGLQAAIRVLAEHPDDLRFAGLDVTVPGMRVIATGVFETFVRRNRLEQLGQAGENDRRIAAIVQRAELPAEIVGELWSFVAGAQTPLAVRSSSLLEDSLDHPMAGVYSTKHIPNDQPDPETRFRKLVEAIKFVYASTFFAAARASARRAGCAPGAERMAVILQRVAGRRHGPHFYPDVSGVARSWNFHPFGGSRRSDGVVHLAFGLGKTIVDGGRCWTYGAADPANGPPFGSVRQMLRQTQTEFWALRMGKPPAFDPTQETEYLARLHLADAEPDGTLAAAASTYDVAGDRLRPGTGTNGPRVLDFAPLLRLGVRPLPEAVAALLKCFSAQFDGAVEIEFALTLPAIAGHDAELSVLQVRPMRVDESALEVADPGGAGATAIVRSDQVVGHGTVDGLRDVVLVKRDVFALRHSQAIAEELAAFDRRLSAEGRGYVLIGFGRWGSADPWLGVPVTWAQIAGAKTIVEVGLPGQRIEMSQGAHFFHNLLGSGVPYFSVPEDGVGRTVDWEWLETLPTRYESAFLRHVETHSPLHVCVDGRTGRGVIARAEGSAP